jgi:hypothetical protein
MIDNWEAWGLKQEVHDGVERDIRFQASRFSKTKNLFYER